MAAAKLRCRSCKGYFPREQFTGPFCSDECMASHRSRQKPKKAYRPKPDRRRLTFTPELKAQVRERDHNRCRWCSMRAGLHVHHVIYRSEGGADAEWNLMALCQPCHDRAHSNKKLYQPLLRSTLWLEYFFDVHVTVVEASRWLTQFEDQAA